MNSDRFRKILVLMTAGSFLFLIGVGFFYERLSPKEPLVFQTEGFMRFGASVATIEIVLIEDIKCEACRVFSETALPSIRRQYIDTKQVRFVFVPVAFLKGSKPLANAALAVYEIAPERFFLYLEGLFKHFSSKAMSASLERELVALARSVGGIDLIRLKDAIDSKRFYSRVEEHLEWAKEMMGSDFHTPALYLNGVLTQASSPDALIAQIERLRGDL